MSLPRTLLLFILILAGVIVLLLWFGKTPEQPLHGWPWEIEIQPDGRSRVFGLTIPESSLQEATEAFRVLPELAVFKSSAGEYTLEAYYGGIAPGGLKALAVLRLVQSNEKLQRLFIESGRVKPQQSGALKALLTDNQADEIRNAPIAALTYVPAAQLDEATLRARFGAPAEIVPATEKRSHWLYPEKGVVITLDEKEKEVLQYVAPKDFDWLLEVIGLEIRSPHRREAVR